VIKNLIKKLKSGKAPGCVVVPNILLKNIPAVFLTYIFNSCLKLCYFPKQWRNATVQPIPKPGRDHTDPSNYRSISLLSSISKIIERIILRRLNTFISGHNVFTDHQFGFRAAHSTSHQLKRVIRHVKNRRAQGESTGMLLILYGKMHFYTSRGLQQFFSPNYILVSHWPNFPSYCREVQCVCNIPYGVPQGTVLSPTLYNFFISYAPVDECKLATFTDDTALFLPNGCLRWTSEAARLIDWLKRWKIKVNSS
jgi:hypothetical protein